MRTAIAVVLALPWLVWAIVRVLGLDNGPLLVPAISFTPYVAATAWIPVVVALALRQWAVAAVALVPAIALVTRRAARLTGPTRRAPGAARSPS